MLQRPWVALKQVLIAAVLIAACGSALGDFDRAGTVRLATTTSTENSGLLNDLLPRFKAATGYEVHVIAVGTGKALRMGRDGDVDVVLVHAPAAEQRFVDEGYGEQRLPVMFNDFVMVGPPADPAGLEQAASARRRAETHRADQGVFVSRGDDSGTHKKERTIWRRPAWSPRAAGIERRVRAWARCCRWPTNWTPTP